MKFGVEHAYASGLFLDYLVIKLYTSDIVLIVWATLHLKKVVHLRLPWQYFLIGTLVLIGICTQLLTPFPWIALSWLIRFGVLGTFFWWVFQKRATIKWHWILAALATTMVTQTALGVYQFVTQHSLAGYQLFGEPLLPQPFGLATTVWNGRSLLLAYGTTPHPNVLAGLIVGYWGIGASIVTSLKKNKLTRWWWGVGLSVTAITVLITVSASAAASLAVLVLYFLIPKKYTNWLVATALCTLVLTPLLLALVPPPSQHISVFRRQELQRVSLQYFISNPFSMTGLGQSARLAAAQTSSPELSRFAQPPHHVVLVWLVETGWVGIAIGAAGLYVLKKEGTLLQVLTPVALISPILSWDHYAITLNQGVVFIAAYVMCFLTLEQEANIKDSVTE